MKKSIITKTLFLALGLCVAGGVGTSLMFNNTPVVKVSAAAQRIGDSDTTWELTNENTVLTIGGTGAMPDFASYDDQPWYSYRSTITTVVINSGVTRIGKKAFMQCNKITSVTIPSSVTSIGENVFENCSKVDTLNIDNIESWCKITFAGWNSNPFSSPSSLSQTLNINGVATTDLVIHDTVEAISNYTFYNWKCLTSVNIPSSVESIGYLTFYNCKALMSVTLSNGLETIGSDAFSNCSALESITFPESLTTICDYAFSDCSALESIALNNGLTSIGEYAFSFCSSLESITLPSTLQSIGDCAFDECESLSTIVAKSTTPPEIYNRFPYRGYSGDIFVAKGSEEAYKNADNWKKCTISTAYMVEIAATTNGTVTVDKEYFPTDSYITASETVTVTVTPNEGYLLKSLKYNDGEDHDITNTKNFTMPLTNVSVTAEIHSKTQEITIEFFSRQFINLTDGFCTESKDSIKSTLKASFDLLSPEDKQTFKNIPPQFGRTVFEDCEIVINAKTRYCYMITDRGYDDFLDLFTESELKALKSRGTSLSIFSYSTESPSTIIVISLVVIGFISLSGCLVLKKKRK